MTDAERELWATVTVLQAWMHDLDYERRTKRPESTELAHKIAAIAKEHYRPRAASGLPIPEAQKLDKEIDRVARQMLAPIERSR